MKTYSVSDGKQIIGYIRAASLHAAKELAAKRYWGIQVIVREWKGKK